MNNYGSRPNSINKLSIKQLTKHLNETRDYSIELANMATENNKEVSIHTPLKLQPSDKQNSILWANIDEKLKQRSKVDMDEEELLELRQALEQEKREALIKDMLNPSARGNAHHSSLHVDPDNNKFLDSVVKEANARSNFMQICV